MTMTYKKLLIKIVIISSICLFITYPTQAIEQAPRISDREIIEGLAEIKEGQKFMIENIKNLKETDKNLMVKISEIRKEIKTIESNLSQEIKQLLYIILSGFFGLIGFIFWDRHTILAPISKSNKKRKKREKLILKALKKYARHDPKMESILKHYGLM